MRMRLRRISPANGQYICHEQIQVFKQTSVATTLFYTITISENFTAHTHIHIQSHIHTLSTLTNMKSTMTLWLLAAIAHGTPIARRQFGSSTSSELEDGSCGDIIFIFARGSTETGNMVSSSNSNHKQPLRNH